MLNRLRKKKTAKKIWIVLAIVILPAFILWGAGSVGKGQKNIYIGKVFGRNITFIEYKNAFDAVRNQATLQFGEKLPEVQKYLNLESQAWDRIILLAEAKRHKIKASDKEVTGLIQSYPFFQNKGRFDNQIYAQLLEYVFRTQPRIFEEQLRQNIIVSKFFNTVTSGVTVSEEESKDEYQKLNEEISIYYLACLPADFAKDITPSDDGLKKYFGDNSLEFKQPLSFNLEYAALSSEGEDEKKIKDKIDNLLLRLRKKADFSKLAQENNLDLKETGFFAQTDPIPGIGWSQDILNLISKAKPQEILPPVYMEKKYYILKLKERKEPYIPDFETIKDKVREAFVNNESRKAARERIENCLAKLQETRQGNSSSIDFESIAKDYNLKYGATGFFKYNSYIENIGVSDNFFIQARSLNKDGFSQIIETPAGFYIAGLKEKKPADEEKFAGEKAQFTQKLIEQKKEEHFLKYLRDLKARAQSS